MSKWLEVAFSGFGVAILTAIVTVIYRYVKKESRPPQALVAETVNQTIVDSKITGPVAGRDVNIGGDLHIAATTPASPEEQYQEHPTPAEMHKQILAVPMYSHDKIAATFEGCKVKWTGKACSVRALSGGVIDFTMEYENAICMKVREKDYPILRNIRGDGDEIVTVTGVIDYVQSNGPVHLKDVKLHFHPKAALNFAEPQKNAKPSELGIVGSADLMIQELELTNIKTSENSSYYEVDAAIFTRMEVASLDKPRTVKHFEIEMTAPDGTEYRAKSEYEVGSYDHVHDVTKKDDWGKVSRRTVREPMGDLAAKVRIPIQPSTHVGRAWVRFEIPGLRQGHEPINCRISIFAVDPANKRHEITTDAMKVIRVDEDRQYASLRERD